MSTILQIFGISLRIFLLEENINGLPISSCYKCKQCKHETKVPTKVSKVCMQVNIVPIVGNLLYYLQTYLSKPSMARKYNILGKD